MLDTHFHIWDINEKYYTWLTPDLKEIYKTFFIDDYKKTIKGLGIDGAILVQAATDINESIKLLKIADENPLIKGVIAWLDFESDGVLDDLNALNKYKKLKGVRPMIQDIENVNWINDIRFHKIFESLIVKNLVFEALVKTQHLENIINIAKMFPELQIVINHAAKPIINAEKNMPLKWQELIKKACLYQNISCKMSGLVTKCCSDYNYEILRPYMNYLVTTFSAKKNIWGSDWPVVNLKCTYQEWFNLSIRFISTLSKSEQIDILENNAKLIYKLKV